MRTYRIGTLNPHTIAVISDKTHNMERLGATHTLLVQEDEGVITQVLIFADGVVYSSAVDYETRYSKALLTMLVWSLNTCDASIYRAFASNA